MNNDLSHSYQFVQYVFMPILILIDNNHHLTNFQEYLDCCFSPRFYGRSMLPSSSNGEKVNFATMQRPFSFCEHLSVKSLQWIVLAIILLLERGSSGQQSHRRCHLHSHQTRFLGAGNILEIIHMSSLTDVLLLIQICEQTPKSGDANWEKKSIIFCGCWQGKNLPFLKI